MLIASLLVYLQQHSVASALLNFELRRGTEVFYSRCPLKLEKLKLHIQLCFQQARNSKCGC